MDISRYFARSLVLPNLNNKTTIAILQLAKIYLTQMHQQKNNTRLELQHARQLSRNTEECYRTCKLRDLIKLNTSMTQGGSMKTKESTLLVRNCLKFGSLSSQLLDKFSSTFEKKKVEFVSYSLIVTYTATNKIDIRW